MTGRTRRRPSAAQLRREASKNSAASGMEGGRFRPLSASQTAEIIDGAYELLETTGFSEAPDFVKNHICEAGGEVREGRLLFPRELVEPLIASAPSGFVLCGREDEHDLDLSGHRVHLGTGGAAPMVIDVDTGEYRRSTLKDLYDAARLVDSLQHVHFLSRPLVAGDMPDEETLDVNTAYACLAGTTKHVATSASNASTAREVADLCFAIAGSPELFAQRPFLSFNVNHVTPPMRMSGDAMEVLLVAAERGIPAHCNVFSQVGASTPVNFGASIAQTLAEALAGMVFSWVVNPEAKVLCGPKPMIVDLRTGAMSGGGGEQALIMAAAAQVARELGLPNVSIAGASDSKIPDIQSGSEKALAVVLSAQAGSNLVTQACGMHAGLMGVSFESYLLDNDMLGSVMSSLRPLDTDDMQLGDIHFAVTEGAGHFLGDEATLVRMNSDFVYPDIADRTDFQSWEERNRPQQIDLARNEVKRRLIQDPLQLIPSAVDQQIRAKFDIRLGL
ncbi:MAG: trimethylamine methyltransferase family protein [Actinomycetota bacterium]|nr:trimethylamine methyltransferase family protein [Actinomycetota bacterium]